MILLKSSSWETGVGLALVASATVCTILWLRRKRPTAEEIERARRLSLANSGRLVDGMLLDVYDLEADGGTLTMLVYNYRIAGVDYECSQDITSMREVVDPVEVRAGFPCSVRYHQHNPQNSIVISEEWSGLRANLPTLQRRMTQPARTAPSKNPLPQ